MEDSLLYSEKLQAQFIIKLEYHQIIEHLNKVDKSIIDLQNLMGKPEEAHEDELLKMLNSYLEIAQHNKELLGEELKRKQIAGNLKDFTIKPFMYN